VTIQLDHLILSVNDLDESVEFYTAILGLGSDGVREPFSIIRVTADLAVQLAPWGTQGGEHLAFAMERSEFDEIFGRVRRAGIDYGDSFHSVGNMQGPGDEPGARGPGKSLYFFDPNRHLIEIRYYEGS
jgi:catechol 2,3-dioxygenase-like lactoylglutathione lyase family enzyme